MKRMGIRVRLHYARIRDS